MNRLNYLQTAQRLVTVIVMLQASACAVSQKKAPENNFSASYPVTIKQETATTGSIYRNQASSFIFEDLKARRVGDILTVVLTEKTNAKKKATTSTKKENSTDLGTPTIFGGGVTVNGRNVLGANIDSAQEFTGEGDSEQSNALNGTISVTVAEVYPNGNLFVRGQKRILLNQGDEFIQISGIVRPMDISTNNSVPSTLLADARIVYSGEGAISDSNQMGWLARFFNSGYWPF